MRGVTIETNKNNLEAEFQLTRLMRGVTNSVEVVGLLAQISTHTPHARRDPLFFYLLLVW